MVATPLATTLGTLGVLVFGRKKTNAEAKKIDAEANNAAFNGYQIAMNSMQGRITTLDKQIGELQDEQKEMRKHICTVPECPHRRR